jgi:hypothetical protein
MECVANASARKFDLYITRPFQNKRVMPIGGVLMAIVQSMIDKNGQAQFIRDASGYIERRILVRSHGRSHPVEYELSIGHYGSGCYNAHAFAQSFG